MKIIDALNNENISFNKFYYGLLNSDIGCWDQVNSTDNIVEYIIEQIREGVPIAHMLSVIEKRYSEYGIWNIWLGDSGEEPEPINSKKELLDALELDNEDLEIDIEF